MKYLSGIDWLSVYCLGSPPELVNFPREKMQYSTPLFRDVHIYKYLGHEFCTVVSLPFSKIIPARSCIVKIANKFLYLDSLQKLLPEFLQRCKFQFKGISRLDLFADFQSFKNEIIPTTFISDFFSKKYLKNGRSKFKTVGSVKHDLSYEYLRFGTRETSSMFYLYDKSKELFDEADKPWIRELWLQAKFNPGKSTWRLEYSFKPSRRGSLSFDTGEYTKISLHDIFKPTYMDQIYHSARHQYFSFKINDHSKNKTRMLNLDLFDPTPHYFKLTVIPDNADDLRTKKTLLRQLVKEIGLLEDNELYDRVPIHSTILSICRKYNLHDYCSKILEYQV